MLSKLHNSPYLKMISPFACSIFKLNVSDITLRMSFSEDPSNVVVRRRFRALSPVMVILVLYAVLNAAASSYSGVLLHTNF
jgi:cellobiose-specific phosphotransferase system component IIC